MRNKIDTAYIQPNRQTYSDSHIAKSKWELNTSELHVTKPRFVPPTEALSFLATLRITMTWEEPAPHSSTNERI